MPDGVMGWLNRLTQPRSVDMGAVREEVGRQAEAIRAAKPVVPTQFTFKGTPPWAANVDESWRTAPNPSMARIRARGAAADKWITEQQAPIRQQRNAMEGVADTLSAYSAGGAPAMEQHFAKTNPQHAGNMLHARVMRGGKPPTREAYMTKAREERSRFGTTKSNADRAYLMGKLAAGSGDVTQALPVLSRIKSKDPTLTQKVDFVVQLIQDHKAEILNQLRKRKRLLAFGIPGAIGAAGLAGGLGYMAGKRSKGAE